MTTRDANFSRTQRVLHWLMAAMILTMLFVGVSMVCTLGPTYPVLLALHRPLGIAILVLVLLRVVVRVRSGAPALPSDLPLIQRIAAGGSHIALYGLMLAMPLIGWSMLSAGGYPIVLYGPIHLPPIAPHDDRLYTILHTAHVWIGYAFFAVILLHFAAALFHALVRRDSVFASMVGAARE